MEMSRWRQTSCGLVQPCIRVIAIPMDGRVEGILYAVHEVEHDGWSGTHDAVA